MYFAANAIDLSEVRAPAEASNAATILILTVFSQSDYQLQIRWKEEYLNVFNKLLRGHDSKSRVKLFHFHFLISKGKYVTSWGWAVPSSG